MILPLQHPPLGAGSFTFVENYTVLPEICSVGYFFKGFAQHGGHHAQNWSVRDRVANQIAAVQVENRGTDTVLRQTS